MAIQRDFIEFHKSIAAELNSTKDRIRNLIGDTHWQTDGEHKEAVLRKVLHAHLPENLKVGRGFVCLNGETSSQIDILIVSRNKPTLFKEGELIIVTPDTVEAIIEVKTKASDYRIVGEALKKLAEDVKIIRSQGNRKCQAGLFFYECSINNPHKKVLEILQSASQGNKKSAINWISLGPNNFFRFWENGISTQDQHPVWHSYDLENLSPAYFISNVVWDVSRENSLEMQFAWFPIEGGKEQYRKWYGLLSNTEPQQF